MNDDIRAIGEVTGTHGAPLFIGIYHDRVNIAGVMLDREQREQFSRLYFAACHEADRAAPVPDITSASTTEPGPDDTGYGWRREQLLEDEDSRTSEGTIR